MFNKIKETKLDISLKTAVFIMAVLFLFLFFFSRWLEINNQTIEQSMVLHHEEKKMTKLQRRFHYQLIERKHAIFYIEINLPMPPVNITKD